MNKKELLKQYPELIKEIARDIYIKSAEQKQATLDVIFERYTEEQTKPEWEIIVMEGDTDRFARLQENGTYRYDSTFVDFTLEKLLNSKCKIHAVKRLSDGEVFTVDDTVNYSNGSGEDRLIINAFEIIHGKLYVKFQSDSKFYDDWLGGNFQKVKEPEWVILSFKVNDPHTNSNGNLSILQETGVYIIGTTATHNYSGATLEEMLAYVEEGDRVIHSIRRTKDGEVFTVGDRVHFGNPNAKSKEVLTIKSFEIRPDMMGFYYNESSKLQLLLNIKYANKITPLFTTEDGVEIYKGDSYVKVNNYLDWSIATGFVADGHHDAIKGLKFSTKEAAKEYILMNKPVLSVNDFVQRSSNLPVTEDFLTSIKELAKSKL